MSRRDIATRLLLLAALGKEIGKVEAALKKTARDEFDEVGVRDVGKVNGEPLGHVRVDRGSTTVGITDPTALLAWAKAHHPDAVETVTEERVNPEAQARWVAEVKRNGCILNEATGELEEPDGITARTAPSKLVVVPDAQASDVIRRAMQAGALDLGAVLAVEAVSTDA